MAGCFVPWAAATGAGRAAPLTGVPQAPQKANPAGISVPQLEHARP